MGEYRIVVQIGRTTPSNIKGLSEFAKSETHLRQFRCIIIQEKLNEKSTEVKYAMPTYQYRREDGTTFELRQSFSDDPLEVDPATGQRVHRVIQASGIIFKGSGFYVTDNKGASRVTPANGNGNGQASSAEQTATNGSENGATEGKSESKAESPAPAKTAAPVPTAAAD
jgi:putative FmdB family regulatory protein